MLTIDGSIGEGGGQILRTSLALSLVTGTPLRFENIRAKRSKPGLLRQHLTAVRATEALGATVEGAELGSQTLTVEPRAVRGGEHTFSVSSAGSACLVLQTVLPPLLVAEEPARITFEGGTHNPFAPPFDYLDRVFLPILQRMGASVSARLERRGFYPAGGGRFSVEIGSARALQPIDLLERGPLVARRAIAINANLPREIAQRELDAVATALGWAESELEIVEDRQSTGPGNVLLLEVQHGGQCEMFAGFGERGVRADRVVRRAVGELKRFLGSNAPVGTRLADQLMLPFALAGGGAFRTEPLSEHSRTNLQIIEAFLPGAIETTERGDTIVVEFFDTKRGSGA
jgi:RNA 3'-terminal phosphate cyclase (ATP)